MSFSHLGQNNSTKTISTKLSFPKEWKTKEHSPPVKKGNSQYPNAQLMGTNCIETNQGRRQGMVSHSSLWWYVVLQTSAHMPTVTLAMTEEHPRTHSDLLRGRGSRKYTE
jgi:hypothetical protein